VSLRLLNLYTRSNVRGRRTSPQGAAALRFWKSYLGAGMGREEDSRASRYSADICFLFVMNDLRSWMLAGTGGVASGFMSGYGKALAQDTTERVTYASNLTR
jgi:hypothetical protein